jgi:hypothetical protein
MTVALLFTNRQQLLARSGRLREAAHDEQRPGSKYPQQ